MVQETWLGYILSLVLGGGFASVMTALIKGRPEAKGIEAQTAAIESKVGPEVDSIVVGNATAALAMQLKVNERQEIELARVRSELEATITQRDASHAEAMAHKDRIITQQQGQIMLLENSLAATRERLDAAEFSLRSARKEFDTLQERYARYRDPEPTRDTEE